ncbi:hypothetical protein [Cellvibrio polysaccharolyticus]|uniref:Uncharacterized protein n=1 Tax=Cellvibrio polysaccharolyticus TaxID=2082724 RepID=A0A928V5Q4_9GAMM|nr:hypothetical protein [Cellvibrio polysaccharolyticus]MBE8718353.1 hypothetical protein [Cellvibrio polysaccharolyticus]
MSHEIYFDKQKASELNKKIKGNFDNPSLREGGITGTVFFSGWFLANSEDLYIRVIKSDKTSKIYYLTVNRPDVVRHFNLKEDHLLCGFQFEIELDNIDHEISVHFQGVEYSIWKLAFSDAYKPQLLAIKNNWESFHTKKSNFIHTSGNTELSAALLAEFTILNINELHEELKKNGICIFENERETNNFVQQFKEPYWAMTAIENSTRDGSLHGQYKREGALYYCVQSYSLGDFNFLLFDSDVLTFYLVQHCTNVLLLFPTIYKAVALDIQQWALQAIQKIPKLYLHLEHLKISGANFPEKEKGAFVGVNLSQSRPYHFVYDYLHGIEYLCQRKIHFNSISIPGFNFIDPSSYFENITTHKLLDEKSISCSNIKPYFYIMPCLQHMKSEFDPQLLALSSRITSRTNYKTNISKDLTMPNMDNYDFVFWAGISVEKRRWTEQKEGLINIIKNISSEFDKPLILIDGRTSTLTDPVDIKNVSSQEMQIYNDIESQLPNVKFINLIGRTMPEKIFFASLVDFFFTSFATDSIYPSCIQRKRGLVYAAPSIKDQRSIHIHPEANYIPDSLITEIDANGKSWHEISVSMKWEDIYHCMEHFIRDIKFSRVAH